MERNVPSAVKILPTERSGRIYIVGLVSIAHTSGSKDTTMEALPVQDVPAIAADLPSFDEESSISTSHEAFHDTAFEKRPSSTGQRCGETDCGRMSSSATAELPPPNRFVRASASGNKIGIKSTQQLHHQDLKYLVAYRRAQGVILASDASRNDPINAVDLLQLADRIVQSYQTSIKR